MKQLLYLFTILIMASSGCSWFEDGATTNPSPVVNGTTCWQYISYFGRLVNVGQGVDLSTPAKFNKAVADHNELYTKQYGQPHEIFSNGEDGYFTEYVITYKVIQNSVEVIGVPDNNHVECEN